MQRSLAVLAVALALAACSTTPYQAQVTGVATGFTAAKQAFAAAAEAERKAVIESQLAAALDAKAKITVPATCAIVRNAPGAALSAVDCTPILSSTGRAIEVDLAAKNGILLTGLIDAYGQGLVQIATAADVAAIKEAAGRANAAITALATTLQGPAVGAAVGAIASGVEWLVGRYLDQRRFEELRAVVARADTTIAAAAETLAGQALGMHRAVAIRRSSELDLRVLGLAELQQANAERAKIDEAAAALVGQAVALGDYMRLDPTLPYRNLRLAHARLLEALMNPELSPEAVFLAVNELIGHAQAIMAAAAKLGG
ncbi:MAG: hypothetical protein AB7O45_17270 [Alphaproteobacteria bacterium]